MQQQQSEDTPPTRVKLTQPARGPFPWLRVLGAISIILVLAFLSGMILLASGRVIDTIWLSIATLLIGLIFGTIYVMQWLFPQHPITSQAEGKQSKLVSNPPQPLSMSDTQADPASQAPSAASQSVAPKPVAVAIVQVFHMNEPQLPTHDEFFGRVYERSELIHRTSIRASTAIDGEYRIGKSWLMQYLEQVAPLHPQLGSNVHIGRLSATHPLCQTPAGFVKQALEVLASPNLEVHIRKAPLERLAHAIKNFRNLGIIPVLCIDEFTDLIDKPGFDRSFLHGLRSIAEIDGLVLITASPKPLHEMIEVKTGQSSPLFNIMPQLTLKPFIESEAQTFITQKGQRVGFNMQEQGFFLECAAIHSPDGTRGWPPLRLQLTGKLLLNDKFMATGQQQAFTVSNTDYQTHFKQRLEQQYRTMVKKE